MSVKTELSKEKLLEIYNEMVFIRKFEEKCAVAYQQGLIIGFCHLYTGQEAVLCGIKANMQEGDNTITSYRCHTQAALFSKNPYGVMCELFGRQDGLSKGKGGSMHIFAPEGNFWGGHGIVGAQVPLGTGVAFAEKYKKAKADIESVRDKVDFVIVAMHWGTEYSLRTDNKQDEIAAYLSGLGVDLIIGAHPHVVQTVEYINNNKTFVVYSLGNFISDQLNVENYVGLAMEVTLKKHVDVDDSVTNSVVDPKAQLLYTVTNQSRGYSTNFRVIPFPKLQDNQLPNHNEIYEKYKAVVNECYPNLTWGLTWE